MPQIFLIIILTILSTPSHARKDHGSRLGPNETIEYIENGFNEYGKCQYRVTKDTDKNKDSWGDGFIGAEGSISTTFGSDGKTITFHEEKLEWTYRPEDTSYEYRYRHIKEIITSLVYLNDLDPKVTIKDAYHTPNLKHLKLHCKASRPCWSVSKTETHEMYHYKSDMSKEKEQSAIPEKKTSANSFFCTNDSAEAKKLAKALSHLISISGGSHYDPFE